MPAPLPTRPVSPKELAALEGVHAETIRRQIRAGELEARRVGRALRIDPEAIVAWRAANRTNGGQS